MLFRSGKPKPDLPDMQAQQLEKGMKRNLTDEAEMRASKRQKGDKADIPAPENRMTSSPSQQDDQNKESSINNKEKHQVNEQKDVPCPSSTPDQTRSDGKGPDKIDCRVLRLARVETNVDS